MIPVLYSEEEEEEEMANFLFSAYFGGHICYHSNGKSQINTRVYTLAIALINYLKETEKQLLFFDLKGGQNSFLMYVPLSTNLIN